MGFRFAVIADSHFHPVVGPAQRTYPSDLLHNGRNDRVVALLRRIAPDFVVHLGDVPHPVPGSAGHDESLTIASRLYAGLGCPLHVVAGNHDVGDKPHAWTPAPPTTTAFHDVFKATWGEPWGAFSWRGCRFVRIDTPILGSGSELERAQWAWLEEELAGLRASKERLFVLTHYPPFLLEPDEDAHYDNVDPTPRARLLALLQAHAPEAVFSGHVHHFFWHGVGGTDFWVAPATSFVRPEYSELERVAPLAENGRDDVDKLGFFVVHVGDERGDYTLEFIRGLIPETEPATAELRPGRSAAPRLGLGVTFRHDWNEALGIPTGNLDEFTRKRARNDLGLLAAWHLGAAPLRVPLSDLGTAGDRIDHVARRGTPVWVHSLGLPTEEDKALVRKHRNALAGWEIILPRTVATPDWAASFEVPVFRSVVGRRPGVPRTGPHSHFQPHGFEPDEEPGPDAGAVFRLPSDRDAWNVIERAHTWSSAHGRPVAVLVELPRAGEAIPFDDDGLVARRLAEAFLAARAFPTVTAIVDGLQDHDRGYFPRHGIVDRRGSPRTAYEVLRMLGRLVAPGCAVERSEAGYRCGPWWVDLDRWVAERAGQAPVALPGVAQR